MISPAALPVALLLFGALCGGAQAQQVTLTGSIGNRAIVMIGGSAPRTLAVGETVQGVRLLSMQNGQAQVEVDGQRLTLRMDTPVSVGGSGGGRSSGSRIVLQADSRGHFVTSGSINGRSISFLVDTGATAVSFSAADAQRMGVDYSKGRLIQTSTANGVAPGYLIKLASVRVGDVEVREVDAIVSEQGMPHALLGNSFINRFSMRRDADQLVLERRY